MSNTYANNITRLCELAFREYAKSIGLANIPSGNIIAGFDDEDIMTPRLVFNCAEADPDAPADDAVWACQLEVQVVTKADDTTPDAHHDLASEVFSQFMLGRVETCNAISAAAAAANPPVQFFCQDLLAGQQMKQTQERSRISSMMFKVIGCGRAEH